MNAVKVTVLALGIAATASGGGMLASRLRGGERLGRLSGADLGMRMEDVREHFAPGAAGRWVASSESLSWTPEGENVSSQAPRAARFEFHSTLLVAIRAELPAAHPEAAGAGLRANGAVVLARQPTNSGGVRLTILARTCPTHAAEARALLEGRAPSP